MSSNSNYIDYIYSKNIQNDIIRIYRLSDMTLVGEYDYDAFGNQEVNNYTSDNIASINPFRYRSYYYDSETNLYYLKSRYYSPELMRFLTPDRVSILDDTLTDIDACNLYVYCNNNPVMYTDPDGELAITTLITISLIIIGIIAGFGAVAYKDYSENGKVFSGSVGAETYIGGAIIGGVIGGLVGYIAAPTIASLLMSAGTIGGTLAFAGGAGAISSGIAISTLGQLALAGVAVVVGAASYMSSYMFSKPNSGRIRYSDGTGIDPRTGKEATKERAYEIYHSLKDPVEKMKWKRWMKGKGWIPSHLR